MNDLLSEELTDLQLFADPFEPFASVPGIDGWKATFVRKGEEIAIQRDSNGAIRTLIGPEQTRYRSFKGMLVSETFANLARLASALRHRTANLTDPDTGSLKEFLPVAGEIRWSDGRDETLTFDRVRDMLEQPEERLRVFVIDGSAGVGKSHLIERIVPKPSGARVVQSGGDPCSSMSRVAARYSRHSAT